MESLLVFAILLWGAAFLYYFSNYNAKIRRQRLVSREENAQVAFENQAIRYRDDCSSSEYGLFFGISEAPPMVMFGFRQWNEVKYLGPFNAGQILNVTFTLDSNAVYQAGPIATVAGAAAGALMVGGAGAAVVGALSAGRIGAGKISRATLDLRINDLNQPHVSIPFIDKPVKTSELEVQKRLRLAEQWLYMIEVLRYRAHKETAVPPTSKGNAVSKTLYETIGVNRTASVQEIQAVLIKLGENYNPDKNPGDANAAQMFSVLEEAFATLTDPEKRRAYDATIRDK